MAHQGTRDREQPWQTTPTPAAGRALKRPRSAHHHPASPPDSALPANKRPRNPSSAAPPRPSPSAPLPRDRTHPPHAAAHNAHPKLDPPWRDPGRQYQLPEWLKLDRCNPPPGSPRPSSLIPSVPPLPRLCDPELFIHFHDAIKNPLHHPNDDYSNLRKRFTPPFATLTKRGDAILKVKELEIIYEFFGADNTALVNNVHDIVVSNDTCRNLAIAYDLHLYLGLPPRKKWNDKWWGDVWEAYWAALFIERKLWNDDDEELTSTLRRLIYLQFEVVFRELGVTPFLTLSPCIQTHDPENSDDIDIQIICDPFYLKVPVALKHKPLGYRVQVNRTGVRCFSQEKTDAISKLNLYSSAAWSTSSSSSPLFRAGVPSFASPPLHTR